LSMGDTAPIRTGMFALPSFPAILGVDAPVR